MKKQTKRIIYTESADYFPKEVRREFKLGEFDKEKDEQKKKSSEKTKKEK